VIKDNKLSFEKYQHAVRHKDAFLRLKTNTEHIQDSLARYSLIEFLLGETSEGFWWDYWMVVTFGYNPQTDHCEDTLRASHLFFDRSLLTNNKLNSIPVDARSKWVCCPEKGNEGHLHFNCFMRLPIKPKVKTYQNEWDAVRISLRNIFRTLEKEISGKIAFKVFERKRRVDALKQAMYSTKEQRASWMNDHFGEDHFANTILSWKDWKVVRINKRTPKKKQLDTVPKEGALDQFMV